MARPRAGQGKRSSPVARFQVHVHLNAVPGREADFEQWYEEVHLPELLDTVDGLVSGRRLWLRAVAGVAPANRHVAIYEIDALDADAALVAFNARRDERHYEPDVMDASSASFRVFEAGGPVHSRSSGN